MNVYTKKVLQRAKEIISSPERWTQGCYARDKNNFRVASDSPRAVKFCAQGAICRAASELQILGAGDELSIELITRYGTSLVTLNDNGGFDAVHKVFDQLLAEEIVV